MNVFSALNIEVLNSGESRSLFEERETQTRHSPYHWEQKILGIIRDGNIQLMEKLIVSAVADGTKMGKLSDDELRQAQYVAAIFAHQATRAAIQGGMFEADAWNKRDAFIQKVDKETSPMAIIHLIQDAMRNWTREINEILIYRSYSNPVRKCLEYIYNNLHSRISLKDLSNVSSLTTTYLSALFKKEVGINISTYVLRLKIKTAQEMLLQTSFSPKDIAYYLNFSSQSYFINCFKKLCGLTPRQFREKGIPETISVLEES